MTRAQAIYARSRHELHARTDRAMLVVLLAQWALAIVLALTLAPRTWFGARSSLHLHVYLAVLLGAALNALPTVLIFTRPAWWGTRQSIAVAQMLWSALLIHLSGGRIETHFHVFVSLAFLAFYRDWTLLPTASAIVVVDHLLRGVLLPESVYGTAHPEWWRFLEHGFWVLFEDIVLFFGCRRGDADLRVAAQRESALADLNATLEARVAERTAELGQSHAQLQASFDTLRATQRELVDASRRAGMADTATAVLHNVGNVLNSINVSASLAQERIQRSRAGGVGRAAQLLDEHRDALGRFMTEDKRGQKLPEYLKSLGSAIEDEHAEVTRELQSLVKNLEHVKSIIGLQQAHAKVAVTRETLSINDVVADAVELGATQNRRRNIEVACALGELPPLLVDRHKLFQILTNLLANAGEAIVEHDGAERRITVRTAIGAGGQAEIEVGDSGVGIHAQALERIFALGFTTKKTGHGFGLHSSACAAREMGGRLTVASGGLGRGARFTLSLPLGDGPAERTAAAP